MRYKLPMMITYVILQSIIAFERGESEVASEHIDSVSDSPQKLIRKARLARLQGDLQEAEKLQQNALESLSPAEAVRAKVASLVRAHDDRLPGQSTKVQNSHIDDVDLSRLPNTDLASASLALDLLRHAVAVESGSVETLANVRSSLVAQMGEDHPRLALIDLRALVTSRQRGHWMRLENISILKERISTKLLQFICHLRQPLLHIQIGSFLPITMQSQLN